MLLRQFAKLFTIRDDSNASLRTESAQATFSPNGNAESFKSFKPDSASCALLCIKYPVKTSIYFYVNLFEDAEHTSLPSSELYVGESVFFDAKLGPKGYEVRFRGSRVARVTMNKLSSSPGLSLHRVRDEGVGDCDTTMSLVNQHSGIAMVNSNYDFIKFGRNKRDRAFFYANNGNKKL
ncbi:hypothetical protein HPB48_026049 [Haemaphysalis longicornis]|uniref:Uncharacterized protein n=1 Tax=Haemaphysalis longicornis TaxID=44386 RepID=A0A9J6HAF6_HAELO|nr:hypothetical protein HPB48_026049 [Haemaphysalis longicornis]